MDDLIKNKQKILLNLILLLLLCLISIGLVLGAAPSLKSNGYSISLLLLFLVEVPIILTIGILGIRSINLYIENDEKNRASSPDEMEKLEKEVEEKVKEAEDLTFNLNRLSEDMGDFTDWKSFGAALLNAVSKQIEIVVGLVYYLDEKDNKYKSISEYAYYSDTPPIEFAEGDGITGQVVKDKKAMFINDLPDGYVKVISGLGTHKPDYLAIIPLLDQEDVVGILEIATFKPLEKGLSRRINEISKFIGNKAATLG